LRATKRSRLWPRSHRSFVLTRIPTRRIEAFGDLSVDAKLATAGAAHVERKLSRVHLEALVAEVMRTWRVETAGAGTLPAMYERLARTYFAVIGGAPNAAV